jgi:transposase
MFVDVSTTQGKQYVRILHSVRVKGVPTHKTVATLGNLEKLKPQLPGILRGLHRLLDDEFEDTVELENLQDREWGVSLLVERLWKELGLHVALPRCFRSKKRPCPSEVLIRAMVTNRLSDPSSKLGIFQWLQGVSLGEKEDRCLAAMANRSAKTLANRFYEAMDSLLRHRARIEKGLYLKLRDLFHLEVDCVFYDLTSSYFEGDKAELGRLGKSRDERKGNEQIVIGLMLVDGLPIGHHVFKGNRNDKTCLKAAVEDIERRFQIKRIILVGDRGLLSQKNLSMLRGKGHEYIIACRKRRDQDTRRARRSRPEVEEITREELDAGTRAPSAVIWSLPAADGDRLVGHTNPLRALYDRERRDEIIEHYREKLRELKRQGGRRDLERDKVVGKVAQILSSHGNLGKRYFSVEVDRGGEVSFRVKQRVLRYEKYIDGTTILKTCNSELSEEQVVAKYKELTRIEKAFRTLKDLIDLRPIFHRKATRISAHVFVCVLALLLESMVGRKLRQAGLKDLSARGALREMKLLRLLKDRVNQVEVGRVSAISDAQKRIFRAMGMKAPEAIVTVKKKRGRKSLPRKK